ncbi:metal-dependent protein hydrolase [Cryphonectria parasitica EP155]|uniref:Metal-dependent protein hydrolase n=1 Tax=Cryphonectria parasitica (strain ATCC 38755 / EP155) TaxID=660469 RepID=A0A9P5CJ67_CRYP1|nr:metal-dependent protein hydrolase [Cryphonectria parasitica EP155]KAF3760833.1 metal-dependent protein hydrolase [Cryphonectria parasitica EP155]
MAESAAKRLKTDATSAVTIGTHNGHFHADEALAVYMLRTHVPRYQGAQLIRTRDPAVLATCDTVLDVGGEYDAARNRFDHHQRGFTTTFPGRDTKLSSAGLAYMHFGKEIITSRRGAASEGTDSDFSTVELLYKKIYESFVEAVDANDNGISVYDPQGVEAAGLKKKFSDGGFTLGAMVSRLNPNWNDPTPSDPVEAQALEDQKFEVASQRIGEEFDRDLDYYVTSWLPARSLVEKAFGERGQYDPQGRIMVLSGQSCPWKDHLYMLEEEAKEAGRVLYVLYPEKPTPGAKWRVQTVPVTKDSFESRKALPKEWRGVRDEELDKVSGVPGCVFVHAAGFIGGNKTFDGALELALKALDI